MLDNFEIRAIAQKVVDDSKKTAHVDQGTLKRSISYSINKGTVIFRQMYYGQWNDNSQLEKNAKDLMPNGTEYKIQFVDLEGDVVEVTKTKKGNRMQSKSLEAARRATSYRIKALISKSKKKKDGKEKK